LHLTPPLPPPPPHPPNPPKQGGLVHGDVHAGHIVVEAEDQYENDDIVVRARLIDLSCVTRVGQPLRQATPEHMSPELGVALRDADRAGTGRAGIPASTGTDCYALAQMLAEYVLGGRTFGGGRRRRLFEGVAAHTPLDPSQAFTDRVQRLIDDPYPWRRDPRWERLPEALCDVIDALGHPNPARRATMEQAICSPFAMMGAGNHHDYGRAWFPQNVSPAMASAVAAAGGRGGGGVSLDIGARPPACSSRGGGGSSSGEDSNAFSYFEAYVPRDEPPVASTLTDSRSAGEAAPAKPGSRQPNRVARLLVLAGDGQIGAPPEGTAQQVDVPRAEAWRRSKRKLMDRGRAVEEKLKEGAERAARLISGFFATVKAAARHKLKAAIGGAGTRAAPAAPGKR